MEESTLYNEPTLYDQIFPRARDSQCMGNEVRRKRMTNSEAFYLDEARCSVGPVLELACGSGRLTIPIAQGGVNIVGVDLSDAMLQLARAKAKTEHVQIDFLQGDMGNFDLSRRFGTIIIPNNSLLHLLTNDDLKACLGRVRAHLADGGRLVFDISVWDTRKTTQVTVQRSSMLTVNDPVRGKVTVEETEKYDSAEQRLKVAWYLSSRLEARFKVLKYELRVIYPQELLLLLECAGFKLVARYGDFERESFQCDSPRQVCVCC